MHARPAPPRAGPLQPLGMQPMRTVRHSVPHNTAADKPSSGQQPASNPAPARCGRANLFRGFFSLCFLVYHSTTPTIPHSKPGKGSRIAARLLNEFANQRSPAAPATSSSGTLHTRPAAHQYAPQQQHGPLLQHTPAQQDALLEDDDPTQATQDMVAPQQEDASHARLQHLYQQEEHPIVSPRDVMPQECNAQGGVATQGAPQQPFFTASPDLDVLLRTAVMQPLTQQVCMVFCGSIHCAGTAACIIINNDTLLLYNQSPPKNHDNTTTGGPFAGHHQVGYRVCKCSTAIHTHPANNGSGPPDHQCSHQPATLTGTGCYGVHHQGAASTLTSA